MRKVFVNIALSLDGYMAPDGMTMEHFHDPGFLNWGAKWGALMAWALEQRYLRETLKIGEGGETGPVNDKLRHTFERTGAHIMGRRMFDGGELGWPEEAPFHTPVFVLTHDPRAPWERPGGTVFRFVDEGPEAALAQAREATGERHPYLRRCRSDPAISEPGRGGRAGDRARPRALRQRPTPVREPDRTSAGLPDRPRTSRFQGHPSALPAGLKPWSEPEGETMIYRASCHCGRVTFEIKGMLTEVMACNCSICTRKDAEMWFVQRGVLRLLTPESNLASYSFNRHIIRHRFCPTCGIHCFGEGLNPKGNPMAAINIRCLEGIDLEAIPLRHFDGRST